MDEDNPRRRQTADSGPISLAAHEEAVDRFPANLERLVVDGVISVPEAYELIEQARTALETRRRNESS